MTFRGRSLVNVSSAFLIQGLLWLTFWLGPAFHLFEADPRWAHNFAVPLVFVTVGLAAAFHKISCESIAVLTSFLTIPTFLGFVSGLTATYAAIALLAINIALCLVERARKNELLNPGPRLKAWLKIHELNLAYLGVAHMPLIFFLVRWGNSRIFSTYLPMEHEISTSVFNIMLLILCLFGIMERYVGRSGRFRLSGVGFVWGMLMIAAPLLSIGLLGQ